MNPVYLIASGATAVGEQYSRGLSDMANEALRAAFAQIALDPTRVGAVYVANALGEALAGQGQLGAALANAAGLGHAEALRVEAAGASGGVALRQAWLAVASGAHEVAVVLGAEKVTDQLDAALESALALALDSDHEATQGVTLTAQWALLMRRYMYEFGYEADAFAPFPINAHANGSQNAQALYRFAINTDKYRKAPQVASPLNLLDCSTVADGAAALIVASEAVAKELEGPRIRIAASSLAVDTLALHQRHDPLHLMASTRSAQVAFAQAGLQHSDIQVLDVSDPHGIAAALVLEASGFYERGTAPRHAADGSITPLGATPLATGGGYKARGDVAGASGVFQIVELARQLRGEAGKVQVAGARIGFAQCLGGVGATAVTHLLVSE
jgi:acetyl-CoA C-acetyltransferase